MSKAGYRKIVCSSHKLGNSLQSGKRYTEIGTADANGKERIQEKNYLYQEHKSMSYGTVMRTTEEQERKERIYICINGVTWKNHIKPKQYAPQTHPRRHPNKPEYSMGSTPSNTCHTPLTPQQTPRVWRDGGDIDRRARRLPERAMCSPHAEAVKGREPNNEWRRSQGRETSLWLWQAIDPGSCHVTGLSISREKYTGE
ncbi:hypothetical protein ARMSODRAFT_976103 [Armillaria solidipes]|uniref:Uncharacterized protein n=1 Tax=Armillaria solidipes TaxID=1076256 RepID=A0A2H3BZ04_9AGAR|nr:hypothetical protein ARMSODRAFT_976103 [Armillaria solidipes]